MEYFLNKLEYKKFRDFLIYARYTCPFKYICGDLLTNRIKYLFVKCPIRYIYKGDNVLKYFTK